MFFDRITTFKALLKDSVMYTLGILWYLAKSAFLIWYEYPEVSFNPQFKVQILKRLPLAAKQVATSLCCSLCNGAVHEVATGSLNHVSE